MMDKRYTSIVETVIILGLIVIVLGGYFRYHRARMFDRPVRRPKPWLHESSDKWGGDGI
jgi:hypothetical protein